MTTAEKFPAVSTPEPLALDRYQDMHWCINCGGQRIFLPVYECEAGRVGVCLGCGEEKLASFTRANSEVA